jgi:hypothetical protein
VLFNQVNPSDLSNDMDPAFMTEFYMNLRILSQDLYKRSSNTSTSAATPAPATDTSKRRSGIVGTHYPSLHGKHSGTNITSDYFASQNLHDRLKMYQQVGGVPSEFLERYLKDSAEDNNNSQK